MILSFDLDDTLYDEITFVKSGLQAVSKYLFQTYSISLKDSSHFLEDRLAIGREKILDDLLIKFGIYSKNEVKKCLSVYRSPNPNIQLSQEFNECLNRLKKNSLYIVTDGNRNVQKNKIISLGLDKKVKFCFFTSHYGLKNTKPSPYCFLKICDREKVSSSDVLYIADDPNKDFIGIKPLGFKTIRILQGRFKDIKKSKKFEADYTISSLSELTLDLIKKLIKN